MSYLGELFQFRDKTVSHHPQLTIPIDLYFRAVSLYPYEGKYFMLLSTCSKMKDDLFGAIYWGTRAFACLNSYPMKEHILKFLEEARLAYLTMMEREWAEIKNVELFKFFVLSFIRYLNIVMTKIGFEELYSVTNNMFEYLEKYIHYLIIDKSPKTGSEASLLQQVIMLLVFSLYNTIQEYNPAEDPADKYLTPSEKKFTELSGSDLTKECIKYSYAIVFHIMELVSQTFEDSFISIILPFLYYSVEHRSVFDYMVSNYKLLKDKMTALNIKSSEVLAKQLQEQQLTKEGIQRLLDENIFPSDKLILGYIPIQLYFHKRKTWEKKAMPEGMEQNVAKVLHLNNLLTSLGCVKEESKEDKKDLFNLDHITTDNLDEDSKRHMNVMGGWSMGSETKDKHLIILDGQNIAIRYGDTRFSSLGLKIAIDYWVEKGHTVHVLLPDYFFNKEEVIKKRELAKSMGESFKFIPDDVDLLIDLKSKGFLFGVPNWNYDDSFIIDYAKKKQAYIVTNDRYNDHIEKYSKGDQTRKKKLKDWVRNNCISFTFVGKEFIPNPDFLNEKFR